MSNRLRPQVARLGETDDWIARVIDGDGRVVYIEAGFNDRDYAAKIARAVALGLPAATWEDVGD